MPKKEDRVMNKFQNSQLIPVGFLSTNIDRYFVMIIARRRLICWQFDMFLNKICEWQNQSGKGPNMDSAISDVCPIRL